MPSHWVGLPVQAPEAEMKTSWPMSRSFLAQIAHWVPYPLGRPWGT